MNLSRLVPLAVVLPAVAVACAPVRHPAPQTTGVAVASPAAPEDSGSRSRPRPSTVDLDAHSTTDPRSIWVVVNKTHPIRPADFRPDITVVRGYQVAKVAAGPLAALLDASDKRDLGFKIASAFRSADYQRRVHDNLVAQQGEAAADRVSARPGYSEHQTGLAVDLITPLDPACDFEQCFARTAAGRWLAAHSWKYGFVIRYTAGNQHTTGYQPEPWHIRYVGRPLAEQMRATGETTLEEVFGIAGGDYR
jgi:D-alanyl-D-alanine carboxypeptidase